VLDVEDSLGSGRRRRAAAGRASLGSGWSSARGRRPGTHESVGGGGAGRAVGGAGGGRAAGGVVQRWNGTWGRSGSESGERVGAGPGASLGLSALISVG
jgi:hypothetical protein